LPSINIAKYSVSIGEPKHKEHITAAIRPIQSLLIIPLPNDKYAKTRFSNADYKNTRFLSFSKDSTVETLPALTKMGKTKAHIPKKAQDVRWILTA
jgi:hypothetical protein